jgi:hypothetical protein
MQWEYARLIMSSEKILFEQYTSEGVMTTMVWEDYSYSTEKFEESEKVSARTLAALGTEGWEAMHLNDKGDMWYFKRPKP